MRSFSTACAQLRARDESSKRSLRRSFLPCSLALIRTARRHHLALCTSLPSLFFFKENGRPEISQILGSDIFFCVGGLESTVRVDDTRERVTKTNIYSSARAEPMVIPEWFLLVKTARAI